ncbi:Acb2/Tad1 domain-containing protein [Nocardia panacis]
MSDLDDRFNYHEPSNDFTLSAHVLTRAACRDLAEAITALVPEGREKALAITKVEEAMFWANAGIARQG